MHTSSPGLCWGCFGHNVRTANVWMASGFRDFSSPAPTVVFMEDDNVGIISGKRCIHLTYKWNVVCSTPATISGRRLKLTWQIESRYDNIHLPWLVVMVGFPAGTEDDLLIPSDDKSFLAYIPATVERSRAQVGCVLASVVKGTPVHFICARALHDAGIVREGAIYHCAHAHYIFHGVNRPIGAPLSLRTAETQADQSLPLLLILLLYGIKT